MARGRAFAVLALPAALAGCSDLSERWELDHARVIAVRLTPPGLAPGETAGVDLLAFDGTEVEAAAAPAAVVVGDADPRIASAVTVTFAGGAWSVTAGDAAAIAAARDAAGLADDVPFDLRLAVTADVAGQPLTSIKTVRLGAAAVNPPTPAVLLDGMAAEELQLTVDTQHALSIEPRAEADELSWFTSAGTLEGSQAPEATLTVESDADVTSGDLVVTVRNAEGGVAWAVRPVHVP